MARSARDERVGRVLLQPDVTTTLTHLTSRPAGARGRLTGFAGLRSGVRMSSGEANRLEIAGERETSLLVFCYRKRFRRHLVCRRHPFQGAPQPRREWIRKPLGNRRGGLGNSPPKRLPQLLYTAPDDRRPDGVRRAFFITWGCRNVEISQRQALVGGTTSVPTPEAPLGHRLARSRFEPLLARGAPLSIRSRHTRLTRDPSPIRDRRSRTEASRHFHGA